MTLFTARGLAVPPVPPARSEAPLEASPLFRSLLAHFLGTAEMSDEQKIQRFDEFILSLEKSISTKASGNPVASLNEYVRLRNRAYSSPEEARKVFDQQGFLTPMNAATSTPQLTEEILRYEAQELKHFLDVMKLGANGEIPSALIEALPNLYLLGDSLKSALDTGSAAVIEQSFQNAEEARRRGSPTGLFSFMVGVGMSAARGFGQHIVNPVLEATAFGQPLKRVLQTQAGQQLRQIRAWSAAKKLQVVNTFQNIVETKMNQQIDEVLKSPSVENMARQHAPVRVIRDEVLPLYLNSLTSRQKANLVWQVFNTADFNEKPELEKMRIVLNSLGPVLPYFLNQIAKTPITNSIPQLESFAKVNATIEHSELQRVREEFQAIYRPQSIELVTIDPQPLSTSLFKVSYKAVIRNTGTTSSAHTVVLQSLKSGIAQTLRDDLSGLKSLQQNQTFISKLKSSGIPEADSMIGVLTDLAIAEANLANSATQQSKAEKIFGGSTIANFEGKSVKIDLHVATAPHGVTIDPNATLSLQEFADGQTLSEARASGEKNRALVDIAVTVLAKRLMNEAFSGSGFIWAEPTEKNIRVRIADGGSRVQLTLLSFGSATVVTHEEMKTIFRVLGQLPLREIMNAKASGTIEVNRALQLVEQATNEGVPITASSFRLAQSLSHLQAFMGPKAFSRELLGVVLKNPSLLWAPLGARWKQRLAEIFQPVQNWFRGISAEPAAKPNFDNDPLRSCRQYLAR